MWWEKVIFPQSIEQVMNINHLIERVVGLTSEEEKWLRETLTEGMNWRRYYGGRYALIRRDKLAQMTKSLRLYREKLGVIPKPERTPLYCQTCGTKLKTMPCDEELVYCPGCDLDHI